MELLPPPPHSYYDVNKSYTENLNEGPFIDEYPPERDLSKIAHLQSELFGHKINTGLGIAAGPLLNGAYVQALAKCGFDVLTYKTVRSGKRECHPAPNCVYVDTHGPIAVDAIGSELVAQPEAPDDMNKITITNSFGMPSYAPETWQADIEETNRALGEGQLMIVSVVGTAPAEGEYTGDADKQDKFFNDFAHTAALAKEAGAKAIEVNFSCPNVKKDSGSLFTQPEASSDILRRVKKAVGDTPVIVKMGFFTDLDLMKRVIEANIEAGADAFCGINTLSMKVYTDESKTEAALPTGIGGFDRTSSGLCGYGITDRAEDFIREFTRIAEELDAREIPLLNTGGVTTPEQIKQRIGMGCDVVMSTTGSMWNSNLAYNYYLTEVQG